jgi:hypothetical protein
MRKLRIFRCAKNWHRSCMSSAVMFRIALILLIATPLAAQQKAQLLETTPCAKIRIETPEPVDLTAAEKDLVCGDAQTSAWKNIPATQAKYFLKIFLQNRGYWNIDFSTAGETVVARSERKLTLERVSVLNSPVDLPVDRYWYSQIA